MKIKSVHVPRGYDGLHIELPGCIVNVTVGLHDYEGHKVTRISIDADGDRYTGEPEWWCPDLDDRNGIGVRVVQMEFSAVRSR